MKSHQSYCILRNDHSSVPSQYASCLCSDEGKQGRKKEHSSPYLMKTDVDQSQVALVIFSIRIGALENFKHSYLGRIISQ